MATYLNEHIQKINQDAPIDRKQFYQQSYNVFTKLQEIRSACDLLRHTIAFYLRTEPCKTAVAKCAREYTSLLFSYVAKLCESDQAEPGELKQIRDILCLWHLWEILCFPVNEKAAMVADICNWLNTHWPPSAPVIDLPERINNDDSREENSDEGLVIVDKVDNDRNSEEERKSSTSANSVDWQFIRRQLLRGNIQEAIELLETCSKQFSEKDAGFAQTIITLLQEMPNLPFDEPTPEVIAQWHDWHRSREAVRQQCERAQEADKQNGDIRKELATILQLICGDAQVIRNSGSPLESIAGLLIYCEPFAQRNETDRIAERADFTAENGVVSACACLLYRDWDGALCLYDNYWLQVHMGHLLIAAGYLPAEDTTSSLTPKNETEEEHCISPVYHITNIYAISLNEKYDMWKEALAYTAACGLNREIWAKQLLLERISSADATAFDDMLECARMHRLKSTERLLYKTLATKYEEEGREYDAALCYAQADDIAALDDFADKALRSYLANGTLDGIITDKSNNVLFKSKHYGFLIRYNELQSCLQAKELQKGAEIIKELLRALDAPDEFEVVLVIDALRIMQAEEIIFNEQDTYDLIRHFQHALEERRLEKDLLAEYYKRVVSDSSDTVDDVISKVRQSLSKNLAVALIAKNH